MRSGPGKAASIFSRSIPRPGRFLNRPLRDRVSDWDEFQEFIRSFTPEKVAPLCGVDAGLIRRGARLYATEKPAISFHGLGVTEHTQGSDAVICLVNLAHTPEYKVTAVRIEPVQVSRAEGETTSLEPQAPARGQHRG